eukprot:Seg3520.1 transcript_id=Seg3520.1/GoldUCD/mRNA.D3Y31 product=Pikachurin protein_id=Seg3520.1/GoldUCD/D3Y31
MAVATSKYPVVVTLILVIFAGSLASFTTAIYNGRSHTKSQEMKNGLQQENFHELNRWKPPVRLIPFDPTRLARLPYPGKARDEELVESESGEGPNVDRQPQCDDEDGQCGESVEESSGDGFEVETATRLPPVLSQSNLTKSINMLDSSDRNSSNTNLTIDTLPLRTSNMINIEPNNGTKPTVPTEMTSLDRNLTSAGEEVTGQPCDGRECNKEEYPKLYSNETTGSEINSSSNQSDLVKSNDEYSNILNSSSFHSANGNSSEHNTTFTPIEPLKSSGERNLTGTEAIPSRLNTSSFRNGNISLRVTPAAEQSSTGIEEASNKWTNTASSEASNTVHTTPRSRTSLSVRTENKTHEASGSIKTTILSYLETNERTSSKQALQKIYNNGVEKYEESSCKNIVCESGGICWHNRRNNERCLCPIGKGGKYCEKDSHFTHPKFKGNSYILLNQSRDSLITRFKITIEFKPEESNGVLLFGGNPAKFDEEFFALILIDGYIQFRTECGTGFIAISSPKRLTLHEWHRVTLRKFSKRSISLQVDDQGHIKRNSYCLQRSNPVRRLYLGGIPNNALQRRNIGLIDGFYGCIKKFVVSERNIELDSRRMRNLIGYDLADCSDGSCMQSNCLNGGYCVPVSNNSSRCSCPLGYSGHHCSNRTILTIPKFSNSSYLQFESLGSSAWSKLDIEMVIKPASDNGLLLYNGDKIEGEGDFVSIALQSGIVEFRFDCGTGPAVIRSTLKLNSTKWHHVRVERNGKIGYLTVDNEETVTGTSKGPFQMQGLKEPMFIGGVLSFSDISINADIHTHFQGCIEKVIVNGKKLIWKEAMYGEDVTNCKSHECFSNRCSNKGICESHKGQSWCHCSLGYSGKTCDNRTKIDVPRFTGHSYLKFEDKALFRHLSRPTAVISFEFKSIAINGLLLWNGQRNVRLRPKGDFLSIALLNGFLVCRYNLGSGDVVLNTTKRFDDGRWHKMWLLRHNGKGEMRVDNMDVIKTESPSDYTMLNTDGELFIGGAETIFTTTGSRHVHGLNGCIRDLKIGIKNIELITKATNGHNVGQC